MAWGGQYDVGCPRGERWRFIQVIESASPRAHSFCGEGEDAIPKNIVIRYLLCQIRKLQNFVFFQLILTTGFSPNFLL